MWENFHFSSECMRCTHSWPGYYPGYSVWNGLHYVVLPYTFYTAYLSKVECTVSFSGET